MKNSQKGFIVPFLIAIIAVLVIGGGLYIYSKNSLTKTSNQQSPQIATSTTVNYVGDVNGTQVPATSVKDITRPSITVLSPNCGEQFQLGKSYSIKWNTTGLTNNEKVYISIMNSSGTVDGSYNSLVLASNISAAQGQWLWTIPQNFNVGSQYKISVYTDLMKYIDSSNNYFSIQTAASNQSNSSLKTYTNNQYSFEIKYPTGWQVLPQTMSGTLPRIAFGQTKNIGLSSYDGEWFVFVYSDSETNIDNMRKSLGIETEPISINGIPALRLIKGQYESVLIKSDGKNYWIHNGNIKNDLFKGFYSSFKILSL